jgi:ribose transport system permease protein
VIQLPHSDAGAPGGGTPPQRGGGTTPQRGSGATPSARRPRWTHALTQNAGLALAFAMLLGTIVTYCAIYYTTQQRFPGGFELTSTVNNTMPLVLAGVAQTLVVLTRGIDLSVGGVVDLTNALAAVNLGTTIGSMVLWSVLILLVGALCGLVNGLLVAVGRLQPILVTLATLSIFQGVAIRVLPQPGGQVPPDYTAVLANPMQPVSLLYLVLLMLLWAAFRRTRLGVAIFAIGNDEQSAGSNGIAVRRTKVLAYVLGGTFAAAAGLFLAATATAGDATTGNSYTLTSIVAVVLGGVSLFGGRGSASGTVMGALVTTMIVNILFFAHIDPLYQAFYEGLFLIVAVLLAGWIGRVMRRSAA